MTAAGGFDHKCIPDSSNQGWLSTDFKTRLDTALNCFVNTDFAATPISILALEWSGFPTRHLFRDFEFG